MDVPAIGIDLGTTHCCVSVFYKGKVLIIPNDESRELTTPSYVLINSDGEEVVGKQAKDYAYKNPNNTIYDVKRILGRSITDPELQNDMKYWPFKVQEEDGLPMINVNGELYYPEQISAKILARLKSTAERYLQLPPGSVKKAVITVPAYFNDKQRQSTLEAGELAGLEVLTILNEPTAAAVAFATEDREIYTKSRKLLVFDLGGGTFDIAVLNINPKTIEVLGVNGDTHLGGEDFDRKLMEHCVSCFQRDHGIDLYFGKDSDIKQRRDEARRRLRRLQTECERAKKTLATADTAQVLVEAILDGRDLNVTVTRKEFETMNMTNFEKTIRLIGETLVEVELRKQEIDDVVLVGDSSRIPKVQEMLQTFFEGKALNKSIHPDLAVSYGAAVQAALMNGEQARGHLDLDQIQDVTPMSLGIEIVTEELSVILPKNTRIPTKKKKVYYTTADNQTATSVKVYQGEDLQRAVNNKRLGKFTLNGIPPKPRGAEPVDIWMEINSMGILHVEAICRSTLGRNSIIVEENKKRMSKETIKKLLKEEQARKDGRKYGQDIAQFTGFLQEGPLKGIPLSSTRGEMLSGPDIRQELIKDADWDEEQPELDSKMKRNDENEIVIEYPLRATGQDNANKPFVRPSHSRHGKSNSDLQIKLDCIRKRRETRRSGIYAKGEGQTLSETASIPVASLSEEPEYNIDELLPEFFEEDDKCCAIPNENKFCPKEQAPIPKDPPMSEASKLFNSQVMSLIKSQKDDPDISSFQIINSIISKGSNLDNSQLNSLLQTCEDYGVDFNVKDEFNNTPLHNAVINNHERVIRFLVKKGVNLDPINVWKETPLHLAWNVKDTDSSLKVIQYLIDHGADVCAKDSKHRTFLHTFVAHSDHSPVDFDMLVKYLHVKNYLDLFNIPGGSYETTPFQLEVARQEISTESLSLLHANGVNFNASDKHGDSILFYAISNRRISIEFIFELVDQFDGDYTNINVTKKNVLHIVSMRGSSALLSFLLGLGTLSNANINCQDMKGNTPLHYALRGIDSEALSLAMCRLLISKGADVNATNNLKQSPLHLVAKWNDFDMSFSAIKYLIENGADAYATYYNNATFLYILLTKQHAASSISSSHFSDIVKYLHGKNLLKFFGIPSKPKAK